MREKMMFSRCYLSRKSLGTGMHCRPHRQVRSLTRLQVSCRVTSRQSSQSDSQPRQTVKSSKGQTVRGAPRPQQRRTVSSRDGGVTGPKETGDGYFNVTGFPFPLGPLLERKTIRYVVDPGRIWTFEQRQSLGFTSVSTTTRMTVIKLKSGGLWVHAPVAPTKECIALLNELDAPVEYIILPTFAYEHKIFVGPFSRRFPKAKVYVAPKQWSWPVNLPPQFFGIFPTGELFHDAQDMPWSDELEQKVLQSTVGIGPYVEVAFLDKASKTLLVTDAVVCVPESPPPVIPEAALLESGGANFILEVLGEVTQQMRDLPKTNPEAARKLGWQRMALLVLFFRPANLADPTTSFRNIVNKLIVSPVIQKLVFTNGKEATRRWVNDICSSWSFRRIIPCHYAAPIRAGPQDFKNAFAFIYDEEQASPAAGGWLQNLFSGGTKAAGKEVFASDDMATLNGLEKLLQSSGILYEKPRD